MRKAIPVLLIVTLILSMNAVVFAAAPAERSIFRLQALGVIGDYEAEHTVTRGEAVSAFVRMLVDEPEYIGETGFGDVPAGSEYAGAVYYAKNIGIINGTETGVFSPDENVTGNQILKMAVVTLGYQKPAEEAGGYIEGYRTIAMQQGLLTGYSLEGTVTMADFVVLLDKMLDMHELIPTYGDGNYERSEQSIYEKMIQRGSKENIKGIVTAVGKSALNGAKELEDDEISIDGNVFKYQVKNASAMLGKKVNAYYKEDEDTGKILIVDILPQASNKEITIKKDRIRTLSLSSCVYEPSDEKTKSLKISGDATFLYNGSNYTPESQTIEIKTGEVKLVDRDDDEVYDVVWLNEYESLVVDRISKTNTTLYFKKDVFFHNKAGFQFDYEDQDKKYYIYNGEQEEIKFEDIAEGDVVTIESNEDETLNVIVVTNKKVEGTISTITEDETFIIENETYELYAPNAAELLADYKIGQEGTFFLNDRNEIVDAEVGTDGHYGYVMGASNSNGVGEDPQIKIITFGASAKEIEVSGDEETIKYNYSNGEEIVLDVATKLKYSGKVLGSEILVTEKTVSASNIDWSYLNKAGVCYKLNSEGKINRLEVFPIGEYKTVNTGAYYLYEFNGKLNSFGGYSTKDAFFIGNKTQVICIPEKADPEEDDYKVDVTITDESSYTIMPIKIDDKTQIAECAIMYAPMDANTAKPFTDTTKISIVGKITRSIDENGEERYDVEMLTGSDYNTPYVLSGALMEKAVANLKCGDLVKYNVKATGEIANVEVISSMYEYSDNYSVSGVGSSKETAYGIASKIDLNRLDDFENEMVDSLILNFGNDTRNYKLLREDGPTVYSYKKSTGSISIAETDEIMTENEAGGDASRVFLYVNNNVVKAVVIFKD